MNNIFQSKTLYRFEHAIEKDISYLNNKNLKNLVVCETLDLSEENKILLSNILNAIQVDLNKDSAIIKLEKDEYISFRHLLKFTDKARLFCFGILPDRLSLNIDWIQNHPVELAHHRVLFTDSLSELNDDKEKKKLLWKGLKTNYNKS